MLKVLDQQQNELGILENAFRVGNYERKANELSSFSFSMPKNDEKNELCNHFNFVELVGDSGRRYGLFRIMPKNTRISENDESIVYDCEHVLSTLLDDVMLGYHQFNNLPTQDVIQGILAMQHTQNWVMGKCEIERFFSYSFENENGLLAPLLSVAEPFDEPYLFTFDTTSYPWIINLEKASDTPMWDIHWGRDMISFDEVSDPGEIVNRIYPLGYGEGVNQLTIEGANNGVEYVEDADSINEWGLHQYVWTDKRFESAETLKANAESLLNQWKEPKISFQVQSVDLSIKEEYAHLERPFFTVGQINVGDQTYQARIVGEKISDMSREFEVDYEIENKLDDIATTQTDMEKKQQVNDAYSQGATNIMNFTYQDNCDSNIPALIPFYIDDDVVNVNTCELTFRTKPFRSYSRATEGGGATVKSTKGGGGQTTSSGGGTTATSTSGGGQTTSSGGSVSTSTSSGGGQATTTEGGGNHRHEMFQVTGTSTMEPEVYTATAANGKGFGIAYSSDPTGSFHTAGASGTHSHNINLPSHTHDFEVPSHTHTVSDHSHDVEIPSHTHTVSDHTHEIELPDHTHDIEHTIHELTTLPNNVDIRVDGNDINFDDIEGDRIDLIDFMERDSNEKVTRGRHEVTITPDALARIEADVILRVFIQSRLGGNY